ncbi:DUF1963 domain-containing protein [Corynebacterium sp.]|uniref:DUF1963 domain-containing protein n=1 Tax=Corynebacterium sp. TaxID=1720 RepID=UPI0026DD47FB|nr:DUF1963 domain-containing protein [Corynebacterium sp.]MDO5077088.1 DUF1963 domain-containing protein [Corynebacterium sp.]
MSTDEALKLQLPDVLAPYQDFLDARARRVAGLFLHGMTVRNPNHIPKRIVDNPTGSRIGGAAFITQQNPWPRDRHGRRMLFVAQINLSEMPVLEGFRNEGLLQFFIGDHGYFGIDDEDFTRGTYTNPHNQCVRYIPVQEYINGQLLGGLKTQCKAIENGFFDLRAVPFDQYPTSKDESFMSSLDYFTPDGETLINETPALAHMGPPAIFGGGWAAFAQQDRAGFSFHSKVLLQIRSSRGPKNKPRIQWGDSGFANFFIRPEDLERWDFSNVAYYWDCY